MSTPIGPEQPGVSPSGRHPSQQTDASPEQVQSSGVASVNASPMLPSGTQQAFRQPLRNRSTVVSGQQISPEIQKHLDDFSLNGSANALLSLLNSQQELNGQFKIVFKPSGGGDAIPLDQFEQHPKIWQAYQNVRQQISQNHQSIAYGLMHSMAMQQQQMALVVMQQQEQMTQIQGQMQSMNMALMQAMINPVIQPMPVPLDYLLGFKGSPLPQQQQNAGVGWNGVPMAAAPQSAWGSYPQHMLMAQPDIQQPFNYSVPQQAGFCAMPAMPPQPAMGLQLPFSPMGHFMQQGRNIVQQGPVTSTVPFAQQLPPFAQAPVQSLVPPWTYMPQATGTGTGGVPPVVINNIQQPQAEINPAFRREGAPVVNATINPVISNHINGSSTDDSGVGEGSRATWEKLNEIRDLLDRIDDRDDDNNLIQKLESKIKKLEKRLRDYKAHPDDTTPSGDEGVPEKRNRENIPRNSKRTDRRRMVPDKEDYSLEDILDDTGKIKKPVKKHKYTGEGEKTVTPENTNDYSPDEMEEGSDLRMLEAALRRVKNEEEDEASKTPQKSKKQRGYEREDKRREKSENKSRHTAKSSLEHDDNSLPSARTPLKSSEKTRPSSRQKPTEEASSVAEDASSEVEPTVQATERQEATNYTDFVDKDDSSKPVYKQDDSSFEGSMIKLKTVSPRPPEARDFSHNKKTDKKDFPSSSTVRGFNIDGKGIQPFNFDKKDIFDQKLRELIESNELIESAIYDLSNTATDKDSGQLITSLIASQRNVDSAWKAAQSEIKKAERYELKRMDKGFPPSHLKQLQDKKNAIEKFSKIFDYELSNVRKNINENKGKIEDDLVNKLSEKLKYYFENMSESKTISINRFETISNLIYEECYDLKEHVGKLYEEYVTKEVAQIMDVDDKNCLPEKEAVKSLDEKVTGLIDQADNSEKTKLENIIADKFKDINFNALETWDDIHNQAIIPLFMSSGKKDVEDLHPYIKGYQSGRVTQAMCLAIRAHMRKFATSNENPDKLTTLRVEYGKFIKQMDVENWGGQKSGEKRADLISKDAKAYIKKAHSDILQEIHDHFGKLVGSEKAKTAISETKFEKVKKVLGSSELTKESVKKARELLDSNPEFAKKWFVTSLTISKMAEDYKSDEATYGIVSQRAVATLLQEFDVPEQMPVAAFLVATIEDSSTGRSSLLPYLKAHYSGDKTKKGSSKAEKYTDKMLLLLEQERKNNQGASQEIDKKWFFRGMTLDKRDNPIKHHHVNLLLTGKARVIAPENGSQEDKVQISSDLLRSLGPNIKGDKYRSTGDTYAVPQIFRKQGMVIKTNNDGYPISIFGIRGAAWEVSPAILLNNPDMKVPFYDEENPEQKESYGFIPIINTERATGNESEGILVNDGEACFLFTLTDQKRWRCRPLGKELSPEEASDQKYRGYATLAFAHAGQKPVDKDAVSIALQQAYKTWCYKNSEDDNVDKFKQAITEELKKIKANTKWLSNGNKGNASKECIDAVENFSPELLDTVDATNLSEVKHCTIDRDIKETNAATHKAITVLINKLDGKDKHGDIKKDSVFVKKDDSDKKDHFVDAALSYSFKACDDNFIKQLEEDMPGAKKLFSYMRVSQQNFSRDFLVKLEAYEQGLINPIKSDCDLGKNIESMDRIISQMSVQASHLSGASKELYRKLEGLITQSTMNLADVDEAKKLWIQGKIPESLKDKDRDNYLKWMTQLTQVNWTANRINCHINLLKEHKLAIKELEINIHDIDRSSFKKQACQLNVKLSAVHAVITEMKDFLTDAKISNRSSAMTRSLYGFMENRNIQLRKHQMTRVPALMRRQAEAINNDKPDKLFLMEGTGGGKSLCMEAMVDNAINSLAQKDDETQRKRAVMVIAPDINAAQLKQSIGLAEQKNDRTLQDVSSLLSSLKTIKRGGVYTDSACLRKIYNTLLGVDKNTNDDNLNKEIVSNRSACLLSFSSFQTLQHATEAALKYPGLDSESKHLINAIRDLFKDSIIFGDECVSGPMPYTQYDEDNILREVQKSMQGLNQDKVSRESICKNAIGVMTNAFLFTGLSATKGSPAIGALFAGQGNHESTSHALNENLTSTRLRAFDRLSSARVVRTTSDCKSTAAGVVEKLGHDQGVTILDTVAQNNEKQDKKEFYVQHADEWQSAMHEARTARYIQEGGEGDVSHFSTGYIAADGKTMLYDQSRALYEGKLSDKLGEAINPSDETALRASGAHHHDNFLGFDQGIGSDPIQGKNTAFVITGVYGATEHGRSDLVEQWAGRGTRASSEPYHRQDIFLTVTNDDIQKIEHKLKQRGENLGFADAPEVWTSLKENLEDFKKAKAAVEKSEKTLSTLNVPSHWQAIIKTFKSKPLEIKYNQRADASTLLQEIKNAAHKEAEKYVKAITESDKGSAVKGDKNEIQKTAADLENYLVDEENFQLKAHLLLFSEMATRESSDFTREHETLAFEGDSEFFEEKMYAEQEHWAREKATQFDDVYKEGIDNLVNKGFKATVANDSEKDYAVKNIEKVKRDIMFNTFCMQVLENQANLSKDLETVKKMANESLDRFEKMEQTIKTKRFKLALSQKSGYGGAAPITGATKGSNATKYHKDIFKLYTDNIAKYQGMKSTINSYNDNVKHRDEVKSELVSAFKKALLMVERQKAVVGGDAALVNKVESSHFGKNLTNALSRVVDAPSVLSTTNRKKMAEYTDALKDLRREVSGHVRILEQAAVDILSHAATQPSKFDGIPKNELNAFIISCTNERDKIKDYDDAEINKMLKRFDNSAYEFLSKMTLGASSVFDGYAGHTISAGTQIAGCLFTIATGKQPEPGKYSDWEHGGFAVEKGFSGKKQNAVKMDKHNKANLKLEYPKKLDDAMTAVANRRKERKALYAADEQLRENLKSHAADIADKLVASYRTECQSKLLDEARKKDELRDDQKAMMQVNPTAV